MKLYFHNSLKDLFPNNSKIHAVPKLVKRRLPVGRKTMLSGVTYLPTAKVVVSSVCTRRFLGDFAMGKMGSSTLSISFESARDITVKVTPFVLWTVGSLQCCYVAKTFLNKCRAISLNS